MRWKYSRFREENNVELPPLGDYATGIFYLDKLHHSASEAAFNALAEKYSLKVITRVEKSAGVEK